MLSLTGATTKEFFTTVGICVVVKCSGNMSVAESEGSRFAPQLRCVCVCVCIQTFENT